jgi:hypothetical protein
MDDLGRDVLLMIADYNKRGETPTFDPTCFSKLQLQSIQLLRQEGYVIVQDDVIATVILTEKGEKEINK